MVFISLTQKKKKKKKKGKYLNTYFRKIENSLHLPLNLSHGHSALVLQTQRHSSAPCNALAQPLDMGVCRWRHKAVKKTRTCNGTRCASTETGCSSCGLCCHGMEVNVEWRPCGLVFLPDTQKSFDKQNLLPGNVLFNIPQITDLITVLSTLYYIVVNKV